MKSNELRIGNLIKWISTGNIQKVQDIHTFDKRQANVNNVSISDCIGIELNAQWLNELGFKFVDSHYGFLSPKDGNENSIRLRIEHGKYLFSMNNFWSVRIEYVHQLQNLYYTLTGVELQLTAP